MIDLPADDAELKEFLTRWSDRRPIRSALGG
jgi:hypothetical protein